MKKRVLIAIAVLALVVAGGYLFIRYRFLKTRDFKPDTTKQKSVLDLRPSIIAKLQQLVKDGSNGLYILSVEQLDPDVLSSKVDLTNTSIRIDTAAMLHLDSLHLLPDDIFTFRFASAHIDGLGIEDLLHKDRVNIKEIIIDDPFINIYHKKRSYNQAEREYKSHLTLYERIKGSMKKISISNIAFTNATVTNHNLRENKTSKFTAVSVKVSDLLIDSSTQHDKTRFLFAKQTVIHTRKYSVPTVDSLYFFKVDDITIAGEQHTVTAGDVELVPRYTREQFEHRIQYKQDFYQFNFPKVILRDIDWLALMNNEKFSSGRIDIAGGTFSDFLDRSVKVGPSVQVNNFPHQLLMHIPFNVFVSRININHVNVAYTEFNPVSASSGTAYFDNINGQFNNVTNIPAEIRKHPVSTFTATAAFMHHVPMKANFTFDLSRYKTGEFSVAVTMDTLDNTTVNKIAEPLGPFIIKTGTMQHVDLHIRGNNFKASGDITMLYDNLHITPLKKDNKGEGEMKNKNVTSLLANILFIKNENPKGSEVRMAQFSIARESHSNFFNLIWTATLTGVLKTIGIPVKFVMKK